MLHRRLDAKAKRRLDELQLRRFKCQGGDTSNESFVLGQFEVQFGVFKGKTFKWLVDNCLGYAAWLVDNMRNETATTAPLSKNKHSFRQYSISFNEEKYTVALKAEERERQALSTQSNLYFCYYFYLYLRFVQSMSTFLNEL